MSEIITTLKRKGQPGTAIYPNIKPENIPNGAITTAKYANNSINEYKLSTGCVVGTKIATNAISTSKIVNGAVTNEKLENYSVDRYKLADNSVYLVHLTPTLRQFIEQIENTYIVYMKDYDETFKTLMGTTTLSHAFSSYTQTQIEHAFDFSKEQADYTRTDLTILKIFIDGYLNNGVGGMTNGKLDYSIYGINNEYGIKIYDIVNDEWVFNLEFEGDYEITTFLKTKYPIIEFKTLINQNVTM